MRVCVFLAQYFLYSVKEEVEESINNLKYTDKAETHAEALKSSGCRDKGYC